MFQSFEATTTPRTAKRRLAALRAEMMKRGVDGFLVPRADAHQGEYVAARDERLAWLTSFTGSAGYCAVLAKSAALFVDGRYTLQVRDQVDLDVITPLNHPKDLQGNWLAAGLPDGGIVAYDPWLHTKGQIEALETELAKTAIELRPMDNLIDAIWQDQPAPPTGLMVPHPLEYSGQRHAEKISQVAGILTAADHSAAILTSSDSIAWVLNTRGSDLGQTPVALAFAILHADARVDLFLHPQKVDDALRSHLENSVTILDVSELNSSLAALSGTVRVDKSSAPIWISNYLTHKGIDVAFADDPIILPKACKNPTEIAGAIAAHERDGVAVAEFLAWVDGLGNTPNVTEIDVARQLESCRRDTGKLKNISFDTISGSGPNGAVVHYRVNQDTNRRLRTGDLLLVDSGGQYLDGTTDITRTVAIGRPSETAIRAFTLVLRGMINLSLLRFPDGLAGRDIDAIARAPLWAAGLDFDHGTGHGVGSYLSVHEGPQNISRRSNAPFKAGMIVSNEPGYYRAGEFGIRIENLIHTVPAPKLDGADDRAMLAFKTLTLAPIDRNLIDVELLTTAERAWLNAYHRRVEATLAPKCSTLTKAFLARACALI